MRRIILCAALLIASSGIAKGQQFRVLYSFAGYPTDGASPTGELVFDSHGNLYGTTISGGATDSGPCWSGFAGCGTVFRLSPSSGDWTESELYSFCPDESGDACPDGNFPSAGLVIDHSGNLYGTTWEGGASCGDGPAGCGTVFELSPPSRPGGVWTQTVLHDFCNTLGACNDGVHPASRLTFDALGNLYGTTVSGGSAEAGTVFELFREADVWESTLLYNFCSVEAGEFCVDGEAPLSGVTFDAAGNLYGTTYYGGQTNSQGQGTIYELSPGSQGWTETVLFPLPVFGIEAGINTGVAFNSWGGIYTTVYGPPGAVLRFNTRTGFARSSNFNGGESGSIPSGDLLVDEKTNAVYGVTKGPLYGNVFKMAADGKETVLHNFCSESGCGDGYYPSGSLVADHAGNLYGTTSLGGAYGYGVVFEITP